MIASLVDLLRRGARELSHHTQILFVLILLIVFPLLFVMTTQSVFDVAYQNVATVQKQQVAVLHRAIEAQLQQGIATTSIFALQNDVPSLTGLRVAVETDDTFTIVAATDELLIGKTDGISVLYGAAATNPGSAYIYEYTIDNERVWHAYEKISVSDRAVFIVTEYSFRVTDATLVARQQLVYLGLSAIFVFLLLVAYWLIRQKNWAAAYTELAKQREEQVMFTNTIAHELRAPLTVIKGYASLLQESSTLPTVALEQINKIAISTERLITLINDFLEVARIQASKLTLTKVAVDIVPLVKGVLDTFTDQASRKGIALAVSAPPSVTCTVDSTRFSQVITNVISNAVKYTDTGSITVVIEQTRLETVIKIKDTGRGISAEDQRKIFTPFTRVGGVDRTTITGSGLGMWITKQLVELLNGNIAVESIEGVGTVVKISLRV